MSRLLWWLLARLLGDGISMTDETFDALAAAIVEDGEAMLA